MGLSPGCRFCEWVPESATWEDFMGIGRVIGWLSLLLAATLPLACGSNSPAAPSGPAVASITVSGSNALTVGSTAAMTAKAMQSDGSSQDVTASATWQSSNTAVATVSAGQVRGLSPGTAVISAALGGRTGQLSVQVNDVDNIQVVTVTPTTLVIDGTCDNDSIFESSQNGEFSFTFDVERSGTGRTTIWGNGLTSYTKGNHAVSASMTFNRDVSKGEDFLLWFTGTEFDGALGADTKFNGVARSTSYTWDGSSWVPSSRSIGLSGGSQCGATIKFNVSSHRQ